MSPVPLCSLPMKTQPVDRYVALLEKVARFSDRVRRRYPDAIACTRGCCACCDQDLSLVPLEFDYLAAACARMDLPPGFSAAGRSGCLLLHAGTCLRYDYRPIICRTYGLVITTDTPAGTLRDCCPENFRGHCLEDLVPEAVLDLERLNTVLLSINILYCRGRGCDPGERIPISRLASLARRSG